LKKTRLQFETIEMSKERLYFRRDGDVMVFRDPPDAVFFDEDSLKRNTPSDPTLELVGRPRAIRKVFLRTRYFRLQS
jgi:hypothetical protein